MDLIVVVDLKKDITTITVSEKTHYELYKLKRKLRKRSFDKLLRYLISLYHSVEKSRRAKELVQHEVH
jgi:predicted CopG family antitoxin